MNSKIISKTLTLYFKQSVNWSVGQYIKKDLKRNCCWRYTGGKLEVTGASGSNVVGVNKFVTLEAGLTYNFSMDYIADQMGNNRGIEIKIQDLISGVYEVNSSYLDDDNTYTTSFIAPNTGQYEISVICIKANGNTNGFNNRTFTIDNVKLSHQDEEIECTCVPYSDYRYGFNGMEKDDEVKGKGNSYNYGARMLDSRLGRWLSIDAEGSNRESNYSAFANNPIVFEDINGDRIRRFTKSMRLYKQAVAQLGVLQGNVAAAIANTATTPANKTALLQIQSTLSTQMGNLTSLRSSSVLYNIKTTGMAINNGDNPADVRVNQTQRTRRGRVEIKIDGGPTNFDRGIAFAATVAGQFEDGEWSFTNSVTDLSNSTGALSDQQDFQEQLDNSEIHLLNINSTTLAADVSALNTRISTDVAASKLPVVGTVVIDGQNVTYARRNLDAVNPERGTSIGSIPHGPKFEQTYKQQFNTSIKLGHGLKDAVYADDEFHMRSKKDYKKDVKKHNAPIIREGQSGNDTVKWKKTKLGK